MPSGSSSYGKKKPMKKTIKKKTTMKKTTTKKKAPKGFHYMPNGRLMKDSDMKKKKK